MQRPAAQRKALQQIGPILSARGCYLAGGPAVALQLGHRLSVDLDWFTRRRLIKPERFATLLRRQEVSFVTEQLDDGTLHGRVGRAHISLLEYPYPMLQPLVADPKLLCRLASLADLAAMKLAAVADRGAKKDFVDLYALGKEGMPLEQMLDCYKRKYSVEDIAHLLYSLVYFKDADGQRMPPRISDLDWRQIKKPSGSVSRNFRAEVSRRRAGLAAERFILEDGD